VLRALVVMLCLGCHCDERTGAPRYPLHPATTTCPATGPCEVGVYGEVQRPGQIPYQPGMTFANAVSAAGGVTVFAAPGRLVRLIRGTTAFGVSMRAVTSGAAVDPELAPGDKIYVDGRE
jgi:protein involved in polysaccharide export with SLBB domain